MGSPEGKENVVKTLLLESTLNNDWNMLKIILKQCWNKTKLFSDIYNGNGDSLLHITCRENFIESTKVLIEHGVCADYRNSQGDSCLHIAAKNGNSILLNLLFQAGANPITKNNDDKQPVDMTTNSAIEEMLRQYSLRTAELQLLKKFNALKELIAEEQKKEHYDMINQKYHENCARSKQRLKNSDSSLYSETDSTEKLECKCSSESVDTADGDDLTSIKERVKSIHITSALALEKVELRDRQCVSCYDDMNLNILNNTSGLLTPPAALTPSRLSPNSVRFNLKEKNKVSKTKSVEGGNRRRKSNVDGSLRKNRLSLPFMEVLGSTESYV